MRFPHKSGASKPIAPSYKHKPTNYLGHSDRTQWKEKSQGKGKTESLHTQPMTRGGKYAKKIPLDRNEVK